ncbi:LysR family transcriptional regulator [Aquabacterium sp.]|uniref:LysR family transcriptional regulator n=1 Tax=Aquabacterium sp. TaxID=1872578 RepID=UPI002C6858CC|nr:LysR family transcriptional regulator [Aquabacterium sp.]HSW05152.1 LysR family transcriptional regulator [Aquabacterium sp.]
MGETAPPLLAYIKSLRAVLAVSRHGSTVRAAEAIHISQPAVARSIIELEKACGLALFSRATKGMAPTPPGARLAARAEAVFQHLTLGATECAAAAPVASRSPPPPDRFPAVVSPGQLRALVAIATGGSETRAAQSLGVTQPAVHAALQGLEDLLGIRLFYKLISGTRLTPAGEAMLRRVKLAMAEVRAMEGDIAAWRGEIRGRIVVGVLPLSVPIFLPRAVDALLAIHPNIDIQIVDGTYESLVRQVLSADVDAIAGALRADVPASEIRQLHLFDDDLVVVARAGHPCLQRELKGLSDLLQWNWVIPLPGTPADRALREVFRSQGLLAPASGLQASSPALTLSFVMQTGRLAIASRGQALVDNHGGQLCIVPLELPSTMRRIGVATRAMGEPSHDLRLFLEACRTAVPDAAR